MKAKFDLVGPHQPVIVVEPEYGPEAILMAAFIRYDSNSFRVHVDRREDGQIERLVISADQSV